jgi:pyruvate dehydrogenase E1 component alpha subunit
VSGSGAVIVKALTEDTLKAMYEALLKSRLVEERLAEPNNQGDLPGLIHSAYGQEAIHVGSLLHLKNGDVYMTARGHMAMNIVAGMDLKRMFAEIYGKSNGYCKGKGGDIHLCSFEHGNLAGKGIIGATIPIAAGAALSFKMRRQSNVAFCFFGDGAANQGTFHEGINMASVLKVPVIYICNNNHYAWTTPVTEHMNINNIADRALSFGIPGRIVDGNDIVAVYETVGDAVTLARRGGGPTLIEAKSMRIRGHHEGDPQKYRPPEEIETWEKRDPLDRLTQRLLDDQIMKTDEMKRRRQGFMEEIEAAVQFAREAPFPEDSEVMTDLFFNP